MAILLHAIIASRKFQYCPTLATSMPVSRKIWGHAPKEIFLN